MPTFRRPLIALALAACASLTLAACATASSQSPAGTPAPSESAVAEAQIDAVWLDGGTMIGIITEGSSTCVPSAGDVTLESDGSLAVTLVEPEATTPCTRDLVPRVSAVPVPEGVDSSVDLPISVVGDGYEGSVTLAGDSGLSGVSGDGAPSAGWTSQNGQFVLLLWGSSSCKEYVTEVELTGDAAVSASLSGVPADKACTADFVPNAIVGYVDGLAAGAEVQLTLSSPAAEPVTIPIAGSNASS